MIPKIGGVIQNSKRRKKIKVTVVRPDPMVRENDPKDVMEGLKNNSKKWKTSD